MGECFIGRWWQATDKLAVERYPDGKKTGRIIDLPTGNGNQYTYGYGIVTTPSMADGKRYFFGMNKFGHLAMYDITSNPIKEVHVTYQSKLIDVPLLSTGNTLGVSKDGQYLFAGRKGSRTISVFSTEEVITAMKNKNNLPSRKYFFEIPASIYVDSYGYSRTTNGMAGDILELEDGSLLISGRWDSDDSDYGGTGLFISQKGADGKWQDAKRVGNIATFGDYYTESLAKIYVNGQWKIVVSQFLKQSNGKKDYKNYTLNEMPKYADNNVTYGLTQLGPDNTDYQPEIAVSDASDMYATGCEAFIKVVGEKKWEGDTPEDRPPSITVRLEKSHTPYGTWVSVTNEQGPLTQVVQPDEHGNWTYKFENLPKYDSNGVRIKYKVVEVGTPPGYTVTYPENPGDTNDYSITNTLTKSGSFTIRKVKEGTQTFLTGAEFTLYGSKTVPNSEPPESVEDVENIVQGPETVGTNGELTFTGLSVGTYFLKETKAPSGYLLSDIYYRVEVTANTNGTLAVKIFDDKGTQIVPHSVFGNIGIIPNKEAKFGFNLEKVDEKGDFLEGATFTLTKGTQSWTCVVNDKGKISFTDLIPGDYILKETGTPSGYQENKNIYYVHIDENGKVTIRLNDVENGTILPHDPLVVANYKPNNFTVKKVDGNGNVIPGTTSTPGAEFTLMAVAPGTYEKTVTVNNNGLATFENIPVGEYTLRETKVPEGYTGDLNTYHVTVTKTEITVRLGEQIITFEEDGTLAIVNKNSGFNFGSIKVDDSSSNPKPLTGAIFKLTRTDVDPDEVIYEELEITDASGMVILENLEPGSYTLQETKAPDGYILDEREYKFTIANDGTVTTNFPEGGNLTYTPSSTGNNFTFVNKPIEAKFSVKKVDDSNPPKPLSGAEFTLILLDGAGEETQEEIVKTTEDNGIAIFDKLKPGKYKLIETEAPQGYILIDTVYFVEISTTGNVKITKKDDQTWSLTGNELELVVVNKPTKFSVKKVDKDGNVLVGNGIDVGAEFTLTVLDHTGQETGVKFVKTTDENGVVTFENLTLGAYTLEETKAPDGYIPDGKIYRVYVDNEGVVTVFEETDLETPLGEYVDGVLTLTITNIKTEIVIKKTKEDGSSLQGVKFTVFKSDGGDTPNYSELTGYVGLEVVGEDGILSIKGLGQGSYYLKEVEAPTGYVLDETELHFMQKQFMMQLLKQSMTL